MSDIRVRFAPSPTGYLHVGGARTALFNYLYARANGGTFVLRIEDTDRERSTDEATAQVLESMKWLGMEWDEGPEAGGDNGPYYQSERLGIYDQHFEKLIEKGSVYPCFCTNQELEEKRKRSDAMGKPFVYDGKCRNIDKEIARERMKNEAYTLRFLVEAQNISWDDGVRGKVSFDTKLIGDFIVKKADGYPTYNFAVVVDDATMKINHILRGDDHISNTPRQILIYQALDYPVPTFVHISMILGPNKQKLSKRHGATSVLEFKNDGYFSDPLVNHLALLGWSPEDGIEVIDREKLKTSFSKMKFSAAPAVFDYSKLDYLNGLYLRELPYEDLFESFKPYLLKDGFYSEDLNETEQELLKKRIMAVKDHCKKASDISRELQLLLQDDFELSKEQFSDFDLDDCMKLFHAALNMFNEQSKDFLSDDSFKTLMQHAKKELSIKGKGFFMPIRLGLSGQEHGIDLSLLLSLIEREKLLHRLKNSLHQLENFN